MKNIFKLTAVMLLFVFTGCDDNDNGSRFSNDRTQGWVQFQFENTDVSLSFDTELAIQVYMSAPLNQTDLSVGYALVPVSGLDVNTVYNQSTLIIPANTGGQALVGGFPVIDFDLTAVANITEPMVFDVIIQSTDRASISVGVGTDKPLIHRVSINPSYDTSAGNFLGDYTLTVPTGDGPFGAQFADGTVVTLVEGPSGTLSRTFGVDYLPGIAAGDPISNIEFTFSPEGVFVADEITTGLGCGSDFGGIVFGNDTGNEADLPVGDSTVSLNILDFKFIGDEEDAADDAGTGGCGQEDVATTILLTKV